MSDAHDDAQAAWEAQGAREYDKRMSELTQPIQLYCSIVNVTMGYQTPNMEYVVTDGDGIVVSQGTSSSEDWVRHDAGGYHTKEKFDEMFPQGWQVNFNF